MQVHVRAVRVKILLQEVFLSSHRDKVPKIHGLTGTTPPVTRHAADRVTVERLECMCSLL